MGKRKKRKPSKRALHWCKRTRVIPLVCNHLQGSVLDYWLDDQKAILDSYRQASRAVPSWGFTPWYILGLASLEPPIIRAGRSQAKADIIYHGDHRDF